MGRKKVVLKRIEDKSSRQVTFSKRRTGLIKKARELSILCDVEIALIVHSNSGKLYEFCSTANSLPKILHKYKMCHEGEFGILKGANDAEISEGEDTSRKSYAELLQIVETQLEAPNAEQFSVSELIKLEKEFDVALRQTRAKKVELMLESVSALHQKETILIEENKVLERKIEEMKHDVNIAKGDDAPSEISNWLMLSNRQL